MTDEAPNNAHAAAFRRVWLFGFGLTAAGLIILLVLVLPVTPPERPLSIPWPLLAIAFYVTEINVIHIHFRRETQAFSLNEIPLVLGLFFAPPLTLVLAAVAGAAGALIITRQQRGVKLLVNVAHVIFASSLATALFHIILPSPDGRVWTAWLTAILAAIVAAMVNLGAIFTAISLSEGRAEFSKLPQVTAAAAVGTMTTSSLALVGVALAWENPLATVLIIIPATMIYLAFNAYTAEKEKGESLEFLYASSRILSETPEIGQALGALLTEAQRAFRSEIAEATLYAANEGEPTIRSTVGADGLVGETFPVMPEQLEMDLQERMSLGESHLIQPGESGESTVSSYVSGRGLRDAMIVPLRGETRVIGALMLANRLGQVSPYREDELRLFETLANNASVSLENTRLERTLSELHTLKEQLRHRAEHDTLTGLANRALFSQRVNEAVDRHPGSDRIAVLYLDLDDFKAINDTFGHEAGDELLVEVGNRVRASLRPDDLAARLGGDEFAVLLENFDQPGQPVQVAERILAAFRRPMHIADRDILMRTSIGLAISGEISASELIRNADVAMYRAKHNSKGRYAIFEPGMHEDLADRLELRGQLLSGVEEDEFVVHYQPLLDLRSTAVIGMEALVRWEHPTRGMVPPDEFIGLAEETGLVLPIGDLVLRKSVQQLALWQRDYSPGLVMSVNISARQLRHDAFMATVRDVLSESGIDPATLILEITERDVMDETEANLTRLGALKSLGVQLAIDDFGTGYSSLAYLRRFPVDIVKIAKDFVDTITIEDDGGVLARAIIELSRALGMATIAEGIELEEQARRLGVWGCNVGQGWLWARAEHAAAVDDYLQRVHRSDHITGLDLLPGRRTSAQV